MSLHFIDMNWDSFSSCHKSDSLWTCMVQQINITLAFVVKVLDSIYPMIHSISLWFIFLNPISSITALSKESKATGDQWFMSSGSNKGTQRKPFLLIFLWHDYIIKPENKYYKQTSFKGCCDLYADLQKKNTNYTFYSVSSRNIYHFTTISHCYY